MQTVTRTGAGPAVAGHRRRRDAGRRGRRRRAVTVTAAATLDRQGLGGDHERHLATSRSRAAGRSGVSRSDQADSRRAGTPRTPIRGPSAGGSGQDNVYQFDGVNVTLPLFGTLSAEPASHDIAQVITVVKGGATAVDFNRAGRVRHRFGQQVRHQRSSTASSATSFQNAGMSAALNSGSRVAVRVRIAPGSTLNVGGPIMPDRLFFYGSYYRPEDHAGQPREPVRSTCRKYQSTRNEGFGKLTFTPTHSMLINGSYRDSQARSTRATSSLANSARHDRDRRRYPAEDRRPRRLLGHQPEELRDLQVHPLREPRRRACPTTSRTPRSTPRSARSWTSPTSTRSGRLTVPDAGRGHDGVQRLHPADDQPIRLHLERRRRPAAARWATAAVRRRRTSSATPARSATTSTLGSAMRTRTPLRLSAATSTRRI